jgi:hypothetical protein
MREYPRQKADENEVRMLGDTVEVGIWVVLRIRQRIGPRTSCLPKDVASAWRARQGTYLNSEVQRYRLPTK